MTDVRTAETNAEAADQSWLDAPDERTVYRVWFDDAQDQRRFVDLPYCWGIKMIKEGFWLDNEFQYPGTGDHKHWIPPSVFRLVTKVLLDE